MIVRLILLLPLLPVINDGAVIGANAVVSANAVIGEQTVIGAHTTIMPNDHLSVAQLVIMCILMQALPSVQMVLALCQISKVFCSACAIRLGDY